MKKIFLLMMVLILACGMTSTSFAAYACGPTGLSSNKHADRTKCSDCCGQNRLFSINSDGKCYCR